MHETLTNLLRTYGYIAVFLLIGLESFGIPLPGETALVTAAALAALGHLSVYAVVLVAASAVILGDNGGYWLGRKLGVRLIRRYGRALHIDETKIELLRKSLDQHGAKTVFIGRFIALLRTWAALLAGISSMRYRVFIFYNALGGTIWATLFGSLGYIFGRNLPELAHHVGQASLALALLAALIVALVLAAHWFRASLPGISRRVSRLAERIGSSDILRHFQRRHPQGWEFIIRSFEPGEYLGLHLTIGLMVSIAALCLFAGVTEDVIHNDPLTQFDLTLLEWLHAHSTANGLKTFAAISTLGSPSVMTALALLVALILAVQRSWVVLVAWAAAFGGAGVLDTLLKHIIRRPRPLYAAALLHGQSYSFPSGHAMASLTGYGMVAYLLMIFWATRWQTRASILGVTGLIILAIGLSRLYLGVHYFSDVVGGYAAGVLWLSACITGVEIARRESAKQDS